MVVHSWGGEAVARLRCEPEREPDEFTDEELADFADRVREALQVWESCLQYLEPSAG